MILFHDWVGTMWALGFTLIGFLIMVWVTLPSASAPSRPRRPAHRPPSRSQLGAPPAWYRVETSTPAAGRRPGAPATGAAAPVVLPRWLSRRLAAHREAGPVDYRIGHLPADERAAVVRVLRRRRARLPPPPR